MDAREVETANTDKELSIVDLFTLMLSQFEALYPSDAGFAYIAEQIADALNISYERSALKGDVNDDGVVDLKDLTRIRKYLAGFDVEINLANADVTGDGEVNLKDLTRMRKYFAGFDVELG